MIVSITHRELINTKPLALEVIGESYSPIPDLFWKNTIFLDESMIRCKVVLQNGCRTTKPAFKGVSETEQAPCSRKVHAKKHAPIDSRKKFM